MFSHAFVALVVALASLASRQQTVGTPSETIQQLVARLNASRETRGFSLRARLDTTPAQPGGEAVLQVRALGRQDKTSVRVLYQVLWPVAMRGRAVYLQLDRGGASSGFFFEPPDRVTPIADGEPAGAIFGTALSLEDLADDFWRWPEPIETGSSTVAGQPCRQVQFRWPATAGSWSGFERVAACISTTRAVPLVVEKYRPGSRLATRLTVEKTVKRENGRWAPVRFVVENLERGCATRVEITRGESDLVVSLAEFSIQKIKSLGRDQRPRPGS